MLGYFMRSFIFAMCWAWTFWRTTKIDLRFYGRILWLLFVFIGLIAISPKHWQVLLLLLRQILIFRCYQWNILILRLTSHILTTATFLILILFLLKHFLTLLLLFNFLFFMHLNQYFSLFQLNIQWSYTLLIIISQYLALCHIFL